MSKKHTKRRCDCFEEHYDHELAIQKLLDQKEDKLGDVDDDVFEDIYNQTLKKNPLIWRNSKLHKDKRAITKRAWNIVEEIFDKAAKKGIRKLILSEHMDRADYNALNTLPASISKLKDLRELDIYRSQISFLPRQIMHCENLQIFTPYTSYRLHWFPYEMTKCNLKQTTISTRALYGNYKLRSPFPDLSKEAWIWPDGDDFCSVCLKKGTSLDQYWIQQNTTWRSRTELRRLPSQRRAFHYTT